VWVSVQEVDRISAYLKITKQAFLARYAHRKSGHRGWYRLVGQLTPAALLAAYSVPVT
jgi:hypothetical protein